MTKKTQDRVFGRRSQQHILILASGDKVRHMTVRPWMTVAAAGFAGLFTVGYIAATSYLVLRDNLIGATMARQARMQHDYEDRISALRSQLDRVTSRQLLDQQVVEEKVDKLLEQQMALSLRQGKIGSLLEKPGDSQLTTGAIPVPEAKPLAFGKQASLAPKQDSLKALEALLASPSAKPSPKTSRPAASGVAAYAPTHESASDRADRVFGTVTRSLKSIEVEQLAHIQGLAKDASGQADAIAGILRGTGVDVPDTRLAANSAVGGPFIAADSAEAFDVSLNVLDTALSQLEAVRETARKLPYGNPAPGREITSRFGTRIDPFFNRPALHAGIDFRSEIGAAVRASGTGRVITAGYSGGYGNMVEIDHGQGITSRYGHLSRISVSEGQTVSTGQKIGEAGNTGRSTGPHLHYEVRRNGTAVDPMRFVNAGIKLNTIMN
ncbi:M23 family metallopeptidase [Rhizobiaceae bacterium BDR2-2]|uniref:M23 family metallopeptidase n=1 Tax=Ectorhizobium quercum TaxID=2965071 RepID=A0AAE3SV00_9HYPH|nr:M23 family metallopeptidase [Ectorhizobium quercum]MCX8997805.1 M23 family metallopeptidase [Ectorhizobium quercum]